MKGKITPDNPELLTFTEIYSDVSCQFFNTLLSPPKDAEKLGKIIGEISWNATLGKILDEQWETQQKWSEATFGPDGVRGPVGPLKHLEKEAREAQDKPQDIEEYADCFILTIEAARRAGFRILDLMFAVTAKQEKNQKRKWQTPDPNNPDSPVEHIRDGEETKTETENTN